MQIVFAETASVTIRVGRSAEDGLDLIPASITVSWDAERKELVLHASEPDSRNRSGIVYRADLSTVRPADARLTELRQRFDSRLKTPLIEQVEKEGDGPLADHYCESGVEMLVSDLNEEFADLMDAPVSSRHAVRSARTANDLFDLLMHRIAAKTDQKWQGSRHTETFRRLREMVASHLLVETEFVEPASSWDDLRADSLDLVELAMAAESEFGVEIDDQSLDEVATVGGMAELIDSLADRTK